MVDATDPDTTPAAKKQKGGSLTVNGAPTTWAHLRSFNMPAAKDLENVPWIEKYRPQSLSDVAAHKEIIDTSTISNVYASRLCPATLLQ